MTSAVGLYYPSIRFQSASWLKLAALYWDKVALIVPEGYGASPRLSTTELVLQDELDFFVDLSPGVAARTLGDAFLEMVQKHQDRLSPRYSVSRIDTWQSDLGAQISNIPLPRFSNGVPDDIAPVEVFSNRMDSRIDRDDPRPIRLDWEDPRLTYLYAGKMAAGLRDALEAADLAVRTHDQFLAMHPKLADVYMAALAEAMSETHHVSPVTDNPAAHVAAAGWTIDRVAALLLDDPDLQEAPRATGEIEGRLASLALAAVIPMDLDNVPIEKIVKLRKDHQDELLAFHRGIEEAVKTEPWLAAVRDPNALAMHLDIIYRDSFSQYLRALEQDSRLLGIRTTHGVIGILRKLPDLAPALAAGLGAVGVSVAAPTLAPAASAFAVALVPILHDRAKRQRPAQEAASATYLLRVKETLSPRSLTDTVAARAKRVLVGAVEEAGQPPG